MARPVPSAFRAAAACLLVQGAGHPGPEVAVVLTARQWRDYLQNVSYGKAAECSRIIDAADCREVMERCAERFSPPELLRLFIGRCDLLVFQEHPCRGANGRTAARTADGYGRTATRAIRVATFRLCEPALSG